MTLIQFIIAIGQDLASRMPLPGGSTTNPELAVDIATDWNLLQPAQIYWKARFDALQNSAFVFSPQPDWLEFAVQASSVDYASWVTQRNAIRKKEDFNATVTSATMRGRILPDLDALIAAQEIAVFIGQTSSPTTDDFTQSLLLADVYRAFYATAAAAANSDDAYVIARGLRGARELHDAGQRFQFARPHAALPDVQVTLAEALALHRAEGAFCMPPPSNSLPHAPLILTTPTLPPPPDSKQLAARTESAFVNLAGRAFGRPGFIPTIGGPASSPETHDLLVMQANGLSLGGLDNLVAWPVTFDNANDELALLFDSAFNADVAGFQGLITSWAAGLTPTNKGAMLVAALGIAMAHLEADPTSTGDALMSSVVADVGALRSYGSSPLPSGGFSVLDDDDRTNTGKFLELATRWYASRTRPETLLARRDRAAFPAMDRLSPYMSYLRFHSGDVIFFGLVLRAAKELTKLKTKWSAAMGRASFAAAIASIDGSDFGASLAASGFDSLTTAQKNAIASALTLWRNNTNGAKYSQGNGESVWRTVGLISAITAPWKPSPPSASDPATQRMAALADAVLSAMTVIHDNGLLEPISLALEYMPVAPLFSIASFNEKNWAANLRKAENFERLRLFIDGARLGAAMDEHGNRA